MNCTMNPYHFFVIHNVKIRNSQANKNWGIHQYVVSRKGEVKVQTTCQKQKQLAMFDEVHICSGKHNFLNQSLFLLTYKKNRNIFFKQKRLYLDVQELKSIIQGSNICNPLSRLQLFFQDLRHKPPNYPSIAGNGFKSRITPFKNNSQERGLL